MTCHLIFRQATRHYHRILFFALIAFCNREFVRSWNRHEMFPAKETLESNGCRKSCNKRTWNVEWHRWFVHKVVVFVTPQELVLLIIKLRNTRLSFLSWRTKGNLSCDVVCILDGPLKSPKSKTQVSKHWSIIGAVVSELDRNNFLHMNW